jgi:hypothetical protein
LYRTQACSTQYGAMLLHPFRDLLTRHSIDPRRYM